MGRMTLTDILYSALLAGGVLLGSKLWVFLSREAAKHRADAQRKHQLERAEGARQRVDELYRRFRSEMEANHEYVPFLGLLDVVHHGSIAEVKHAYETGEDMPLVVVHKLQQLHEAKADYLSHVSTAGEAGR
jgi:hypothetical protein